MVHNFDAIDALQTSNTTNELFVRNMRAPVLVAPLLS
jgi:hypothetical protein